MSFQTVADRASKWAGSRWAFAFAFGTVIVWAATGPAFNYSETWQLFINTGTTIVTFLMVFLIQNSQNRGDAAIHVKLDELVRVNDRARNELAGLEAKTEEEIEAAKVELQETMNAPTAGQY